MNPPVLTTARLKLRQLTDADAAFLVRLLNDPAFIANIGDRGVRDEADARAYLATGPRASYHKHGFGLYRVERDDGTPIGICGLLKRENLELPDIGYALLPEHRGSGYAREAAVAVLGEARDRFRLVEICAVVSPGNAPSIALLEALGFVFDSEIAWGDPATPTLLYRRTQRKPNSSGSTATTNAAHKA
ncbi:MAG: GNAT family N-acetyltransferase [Wenzhouxiangellaceae bacterium]|nr:GNAT family N-acetyltransferase [Wenzhouxiangellaceae bacterium]